jgi:DivIVA domain-containing protein
MSESPRWERESQEDLSAPAPQPDATVEFNVDADCDDDPDEAPREPRLAAARESLLASRETARESLSTTADRLSTTATRCGRWFAGLDRRPDFDASARRDPIAELTPGAPDDDTAEHPDDVRPARFPLALRGYDRDAVDAHFARLETENALLREQTGPPMSITEEIERLGEQTASILVVAHDKAHETARDAHAQAARAVSDAARDAERITTEAERRLRELDEETDAVWRERERLLDDVREVSVTLATLADTASERFPPAEPEPVTANAE